MPALANPLDLVNDWQRGQGQHQIDGCIAPLARLRHGRRICNRCMWYVWMAVMMVDNEVRQVCWKWRGAHAMERER